jgi:pyruvate dehydrogenase E2 component (dihydrolipoamide acetyltransferase)
MKFFKLPDLGEGLAEAEIVEWKVSAGDTVQVDQVLLSVETAKALVDVPHRWPGSSPDCAGRRGHPPHRGTAGGV